MINQHHHQQQQSHTVVPIAPPPVPPSVLPQSPNLPCTDLLQGLRENYIKVGVPLYEAAMKGDWQAAKPILDKQPDLVRFAITDNCETLLHIAASATRIESNLEFVSESQLEFVINLVNMMEIEDLELQNRNSNTALSLAAAAHNIKAARVMVEKNPKLMEILDNNRMTPLAMAALLSNSDMLSYLYDASNKMSSEFWSPDDRGWVLQKCVVSDIFYLALTIVNDHPEIMVNKEILSDVLLALAEKTHVFYGRKPHIVFRIIKSMLHVKVGHYKEENVAMQLLRIIWEKISTMEKSKIDDILRGRPLKEGNTIKGYPSRVLFHAVKMHNTPFVIELIRLYPDLIWEQDDKGKTIFHLAVKQRQADIYNMLYEFGGRTKLILLIEDKKGNNLLHMVGKRAKLTSYRNVPGGVALQMQRELTWFTHILLRIPRHYSNKKNKAGETPQELFTRTHADLLTEAKNWMKETSAQCMVVTTLITTIAFTAAFTLPGGYNQDSGVPFYRKRTSLVIFVISDAISLICSSTSVLIFLSILTSSFGEHEFSASLPNKLANGLATLFLSIVTMMIAFTASFFVLYNEELQWMPITLTSLASVPVLLFVMLQYRLFESVFFSWYRTWFLFWHSKHILYD